MIPKGAAGGSVIAAEAERCGLALVDFWNDNHAIPLPGRPGEEVL
jgi:hypothetical protein